jgi:predicted RNA-binding Zn-ribbon protein involved in translation (DUF1610 family)
MESHKYICPECKEKAGVDIVYGYPTDETFKSAHEGKLVLGGCVRNVDISNPAYRCKKCGYEW